MLNRLDKFWQGEFGDQYVVRTECLAVGDLRFPFWDSILAEFAPRNVLEVGCNSGPNLRWFGGRVPPENTVGLDVNASSLRKLKEIAPGVHAVRGRAGDLPFPSGWFDLVFTFGVLIHQAEETLAEVMREVMRCSRRYVLCGEYFSKVTKEVDYLGNAGALFRRDFGRIYQEMFPALALRKKGELDNADGFAGITWWLFEKKEA